MKQQTLFPEKEKFIEHRCTNRYCEFNATKLVFGNPEKICPFCGHNLKIKIVKNAET